MSAHRRSRRQRKLNFTKMHGLGNDFIVIDRLSQAVQIDKKLIVRLADRHFGIGCDQVLVVDPPDSPDTDFRYRIFNPDGSEVEQCGNGARCFARYVRARKLCLKDTIRVETLGGVIEIVCRDHNRIQVDMGTPVLDPATVPFSGAAAADDALYTLALNGGHGEPAQNVEIGVVSMGNPHAVVLCDDVDRAPLDSVGKLIQQHPRFVRQANVGFMQVVTRGHIRLRVLERGAGETLACGSGACAAVVSGRLRGLLDSRVKVSLPGGALDINWRGGSQPVLMTGPAAFVFDGSIVL